MAQKTGLFEDDDAASLDAKTTSTAGIAPSNALVIGGHTLVPEQKQFNLLLAKIDKLKNALIELNAVADDFHQQYRKKISPLLAQQQALNKQMVIFLDQRLQGKGLSATVREGMAEIVCGLAVSLLSGPDAAEMQALLERYSPDGSEFDDEFDDEEEDALIAAEMKSMMSNMFGIDLNDDELQGSPEDVFAATMRKMHEAEQARQSAKASRKKKTAKQKLAEQDDVDAGRALREIYRKLASALHPDRETDEIERLRKTALMKQANAAYEKKDLLALLQLQLAAEQINPSSMTAVAQDKLRHFNRVLKEQASSLQSQLRSAEQALRMELGLDMYTRIAPGALQAALRQQVQGINAQIQFMQRDLQAIQNDPALKRWVKEQMAMMDDRNEFF